MIRAIHRADSADRYLRRIEERRRRARLWHAMLVRFALAAALITYTLSHFILWHP